LDVNPSAENQSGYSRTELLKMNILRDLPAEEIASDVSEQRGKKLNGGNSIRFTEKKRRKDGSEYWTEVMITKISSGNEKIALSVNRDITEQKLVEQALRESEDKFRSFIETSADIVFRLSKSGRIDYVSPRVEDLYGYMPDELVGKHLSSTTPVKEVPRAVKALSTVFAGKPLKNFKINQTHKAGHNIPMEINAVPVYKNGKIVGIQGITRDITERKQAEEKIQHLNMILRSVRDINQLITKEKNRNVLLQQACKILTRDKGYYNVWLALFTEDKKLDFITQAGNGKKFQLLKDDFTKGKLCYCSKNALNKPGLFLIEKPKLECGDCPGAYMCKGNSGISLRLEYNQKVYGLLTASTETEYLFDEDILKLFREVTEDIAFAIYRLELEEAHRQVNEFIKESEFNLRSLFNAMTDVVLEIDYDGRYLTIAPTSPDLLYKPATEVLGKTLHEVFPNAEADIFLKLIRKSLNESSIERIEYPLNIGNKVIWFEGRVTPKTKNTVLYTARDITDRNQAQDALIE